MKEQDEKSQDLRIPVYEITSDEDGITHPIKRYKKMTWFEKFLRKVFSPSFEQLTKDLEQIKKDVEQLSEIKQKQDTLSEILNQIPKIYNNLNGLSEEIKGINPILATVQTIERLVSAYVKEENRKNAAKLNNYKEAINSLANINEQLKSPYIIAAKQSEIIDLLAHYLCDNSQELKYQVDSFIKNSTIDDNTKSKISILLGDIDDFNGKYRNSIVQYLLDIGSNWAKCVIYPSSKIFDSDTMNALNGMPINNGDTISVVSLGLDFPNSDIHKPRPTVCRNDR